MDKLFDKVWHTSELPIYEFDIKKSLKTAAVTGLIGAGAMGLGLAGADKEEPAKPDTKPAATAPAEISKEEPEEQKWQEVRMKVTAYCAGPECTGTHSPGITASGHKIQDGDVFVAADKRYPFGTEMVVPGYNNDKPVKVLDRGGAIKGDRVDVFFPTHEEALEWGVQNLDVKVGL
jgi:3D (Asp-Asp-Asp) domain-containing protein